jgi:hypothetical protein
VNIPARLGYTPVNKAGDNVTGTFVFGTAGGNRAEARASGDLLTRTGPDRGILRFGDSNARYIEYNESRFYFNECEIYSGPNNSLTWNAGNDGAGSGLDADLLDGRQASDFALLSGAQFQGNGTGVVSNGDWTLFSLRNNQGSASAVGNTSLKASTKRHRRHLHAIAVRSDGKSTVALARPGRQPHRGPAQNAAYIRGRAAPPTSMAAGCSSTATHLAGTTMARAPGSMPICSMGSRAAGTRTSSVDWAMPRCNRERVSASSPMPSRWAGMAASCS